MPAERCVLAGVAGKSGYERNLVVVEIQLVLICVARLSVYVYRGELGQHRKPRSERPQWGQVNKLTNPVGHIRKRERLALVPYWPPARSSRVVVVALTAERLSAALRTAEEVEAYAHRNDLLYELSTRLIELK